MDARRRAPRRTRHRLAGLSLRGAGDGAPGRAWNGAAHGDERPRRSRRDARYVAVAEARFRLEAARVGRLWLATSEPDGPNAASAVDAAAYARHQPGHEDLAAALAADKLAA